MVRSLRMLSQPFSFRWQNAISWCSRLFRSLTAVSVCSMPLLCIVAKRCEVDLSICAIFDPPMGLPPILTTQTGEGRQIEGVKDNGKGGQLTKVVGFSGRF